jgi:hypothetical protein
MQTFLPYASFTRTAKILDRARLGKQRVEAKQIILTLEEGGTWENHPAVRMWRGHIPCLASYGNAICHEWLVRGYEDNLQDFFLSRIDANCDLPEWFGYQPFHISHQSNLIRKDSSYYWHLFSHVPDNLPYLWPC